MKILGIDGSLTNTGIAIYNTELSKFTLIKNISFKEKYKKDFLQEIDKIDANLRKDAFVKALWDCERLSVLYNNLYELDFDILVVENQFQNDVNEVQAVLKTLAGSKGIHKTLSFYHFYLPQFLSHHFVGGSENGLTILKLEHNLNEL